MIVGLFAVFAVAGYRVAMRAPDRFGALLAAGCHDLGRRRGGAQHRHGHLRAPRLRCAAPVPLGGGSSLVILMVAAGILVNVARRCEERGAARPA